MTDEMEHLLDMERLEARRIALKQAADLCEAEAARAKTIDAANRLYNVAAAIRALPAKEPTWAAAKAKEQP